MKPQISIAFVALLLVGCAAAEKATLVGLVTISQANTQGVILLAKADQAKQQDFRNKFKAAKNLAEHAAIDVEFKKHNETHDKALLGFTDIDKAINAVKEAMKAGLKGDLTAAVKAYLHVQSLLKDLGVTMPAIPGLPGV